MGRLALSFPELKGWGFAAATNSKMLPKPEPGAMGEHLVVPAIGGGDVARGEWTNVRGLEHFLQLLNVANDAFDVHVSPSSKRRRQRVNLK